MANPVKRQSGAEARRRQRPAPSREPEEWLPQYPPDMGTLIREQRLIRKMSQEELGERIGVTFQQIQKYEKGANRISAERLIRIAETLNVPVSFFLARAKPSPTANAKGLAPRIQRTIVHAQRVFGDSNKAHRWLLKPKRALGGQTPLSVLSDEAGARKVEEMLHQIEHGMYA